MANSKLQEGSRRERILDAAVDLISHYGYDKTTVDDIARDAGVSKGAVYLEFSSKDALFEALLLRQLMRYAEEWIRLIDNDPGGGTLGAMYKNSLYALGNNPFMAAMFGRDRRVFGAYLRKPGNLLQRMQEGQGESARYVFVKKMQEAGLVRRDMDALVIAHIMNLIGSGLVAPEQFTPESERPSVEATIEGIATLMDAALTPENADSDAGKAILHEVFSTGRDRYQGMIDGDQGMKND